MTTDYLSLIFMSLLPLASSTVTPGQDHDFTIGFTHDQLTNQETTSFNPHSKILGHDITQSVLVEKTQNPTQNLEPSAKPLLQTAGTTPLKILFPNTQTAVTPTNSISLQSNSLTVGLKRTTDAQFEVLTSTTTVVTSSARNLTTTTGTPSMLRSTKTQESGGTSQSVSDKISYSSTRPNLNSTTTTSTKPVEKESTSIGPVTGGDAMSTGFGKTSLATTKTPIIHITKKRKQNTPEKSKNGPNHSKVVAGLIGGALVLMMVGFLVIYIKKRKLQRQQITTTDWAGPSPFLENGVDNDQVTLRSSNRISLSSFLPQRLSKRLSMLPETDEELKDMTSGTTFGESLNSRNVDGNDVQKSNGSAVVNVGLKNTGNAPKNVENSVSDPSSQTEDLLSINNNMEATNLIEDHPVNPPTLSGAVDNGAFSHKNEDLGQP